jgi:hypothetical protein
VLSTKRLELERVTSLHGGTAVDVLEPQDVVLAEIAARCDWLL